MAWPVVRAAWSSLPAQSLLAPPCGDVWGSPADRKAIEQAMHSGTAEAVTAAINQAKQMRGARVGCPEHSYSHKAPNFAELSLDQMRGEWQKSHATALAAYRESCPRAARNWGLPALGGYYARQAGEAVDLAALARIADILEATQYKVAHAPAPLKHRAGMFGYLSVPESDTCADKTDIAGRPLYRILEQMCGERPGRCAIYNAGLFTGKRFVVADVEPPRDLDGGGAYDHGIAGVMMIEAAVGQSDPQLPDPMLKDKYRAAALLAGEWAIEEPPVRNHNYTAKLVWLLAELYDWTGEQRFRAALLDKLDRNLLPGVLMDADNDGKVDGMNDQPFATLATIAQRPGRYWDGHNARPVYQAMNAFALVEAYAALRDRGDQVAAARVRPYVHATLDNLALEITQLGVPSSGYTMVPYALLLGMYKIAAVERRSQPAWERAFAAYWNARTKETTPEQTHIAGLYLLYKSGKPYTPLRKRK